MQKLELPAPWGVGAMLGLHLQAYQPRILAPGPAELWQVSAEGDLRGALDELMARAKRRMMDLPRVAPWISFCRAGLLGRISVRSCQPYADPRMGCLITLADPRPDWLEDAA